MAECKVLNIPLLPLAISILVPVPVHVHVVVIPFMVMVLVFGVMICGPFLASLLVL
jgi:hypothetical protein